MRSGHVCGALLVVLLAACASPAPDAAPPTSSAPVPAPTHETRGPATMPDLVGLGSAAAGRRIAKLGLGSEWDTVVVRCESRPGTVVRQSPAPGVVLSEDATVRVRTGALDLDEFRGPCEPADGDLGPVTGEDATLARQFYRFAADPSRGAPFAAGEVWTGIESGPTGTTLGPAQRDDLAAWRLDTEYAERSGPFSALDVVAGSGGYYELRRGVVGTCPAGDGEAPPELVGLRAVSLTAPADTVGACLEWWGVTLFLDDADRIRGVALRLGSP